MIDDIPLEEAMEWEKEAIDAEKAAKKYKSSIDELLIKASKMSKRQAMAYLKKHEVDLKKQAREVDRKKKALEERIKSLKVVAEALDSYKGMAGWLYFNTGEKMKPNINGIWISEGNDEGEVTLINFNDFIQNEDSDALRLVFHMGKGKQIGQDGEEVKFGRGELLLLSNQELTPMHKGMGIHMANIAPSVEQSQIQYEYALWKLGLGIKPVNYIPTVVIDGQFRRGILEYVKKDEN